MAKLTKAARNLKVGEILCKRCSGTGIWIEKTSVCYRCKGTGVEVLKQSNVVDLQVMEARSS